MSEPIAVRTDFSRVYTLAQTALDDEIMVKEGIAGPCITYHDQIIAELRETGLLWLKCPADQKVLLLDISPDIYFETDELVGQDGVFIRMTTITDQELALRLSDALASSRRPLSRE